MSTRVEAYGRSPPALCHLFSRARLVGLSGSFPSPTAVCPLLPVGCKTALSLRDRFWSVDILPEQCVSGQQATVPLAWTHSVSAGRTGCLVLRLGVFSPQLLILQFPLYLENQRSWSGSVSASLVCSCWHCCFSHNTVPREYELVCLLQSGSPGLFSNCYCHCEPQGLKLHTICTLRCVLTVPRGGFFPPEVIILGGP